MSDNPQDLIALTNPARAKSSSASLQPFMWPSTWPERYDNKKNLQNGSKIHQRDLENMDLRISLTAKKELKFKLVDVCNLKEGEVTIMDGALHSQSVNSAAKNQRSKSFLHAET